MKTLGSLCRCYDFPWCFVVYRLQVLTWRQDATQISTPFSSEVSLAESAAQKAVAAKTAAERAANGWPSYPFDQEECYARATVAATRSQSLTVIVSPVDMMGIMGMIQVLAARAHPIQEAFQANSNWTMPELRTGETQLEQSDKEIASWRLNYAGHWQEQIEQLVAFVRMNLLELSLRPKVSPIADVKESRSSPRPHCVLKKRQMEMVLGNPDFFTEMTFIYSKQKWSLFLWPHLFRLYRLLLVLWGKPATAAEASAAEATVLMRHVNCSKQLGRTFSPIFTSDRLAWDLVDDAWGKIKPHVQARGTIIFGRNQTTPLFLHGTTLAQNFLEWSETWDSTHYITDGYFSPPVRDESEVWGLTWFSLAQRQSTLMSCIMYHMCPRFMYRTP